MKFKYDKNSEYGYVHSYPEYLKPNFFKRNGPFYIDKVADDGHMEMVKYLSKWK